ncbi:MAG: response regulator transcription factor [Acetatifactor sp.]|nr:response regulator transcription factor [Acetatifactor sp.]
MTKVAFCDDELSMLNKLQVLLDGYRVKQNREIEYTAFCSPLELLAAIERGIRFDVLLLDVLMPGENGIDTAAEIRRYDNNVKIIFLTSSAEFAVQSYAVSAFFYQLKPIQAESFFRVMDAVLDECEKEQTDSLILRCKGGITRIELKTLEYCEVIHRTLFFHLTNGKVLESTGSLDELCGQLKPYGNFLRPHRSYLVNLEYVQNLSARAITMSCLTEIPIPRGKYNEVKNTFLEYSFRDRQVIL